MATSLGQFSSSVEVVRVFVVFRDFHLLSQAQVTGPVAQFVGGGVLWNGPLYIWVWSQLIVPHITGQGCVVSLTFPLEGGTPPSIIAPLEVDCAANVFSLLFQTLTQNGPFYSICLHTGLDTCLTEKIAKNYKDYLNWYRDVGTGTATYSSPHPERRWRRICSDSSKYVRSGDQRRRKKAHVA